MGAEEGFHSCGLLVGEWDEVDVAGELVDGVMCSAGGGKEAVANCVLRYDLASVCSSFHSFSCPAAVCLSMLAAKEAGRP